MYYLMPRRMRTEGINGEKITSRAKALHGQKRCLPTKKVYNVVEQLCVSQHLKERDVA